MTSKLEINIRSLVAHCEEMTKENSKDWRLKTYLKSLEIMLKELEDETDVQVPSNCTQYRLRCNKLKELTNYVEPEINSLKSKRKLKDNLDSGTQVLQEIKQVESNKYHGDLRKELMGNDELNFGVRKRGVGEDMGQTVKYYSDMQEKIAEDMLTLTRNLKEQTETANKIIKKDTAVVTKSSNLSDKNITSLGSEDEKLQDHSKKAWKCWMWIMIMLVMVIFIGMVLFMKIVKKKVRS